MGISMKIAPSNNNVSYIPDASQHIRIGATVFLISPQNRILMGLRKSLHGQGTWGLVGGHVEYGEDPQVAAVREAYEEAGIKIAAPQLLGITSDIFVKNNQHYLTLFYKIRIDDEHSARNMEPEKFEEWRWFDPVTMPSNLFLSLQNLIDQVGGKETLRDMILRD